jgi:hypothetical protein
MDCLRRVNPYLDIISTSALTPDGVRPWYDFVRAEARRKSPL